MRTPRSFAVPSKQRFRSHDGGDLREGTPTDSFGKDRESTTLIIGESESAVTDLFAEDSVLLGQVIDGVLLMLVQPA